MRRFVGYLGFHLHHEHYPILYFGDLLTHPPFPVAFPFVMSAVTIPVPTLVLMVCGFALLVLSAVRAVVHLRMGPLKEVELTIVPLGDVARSPSGQPALLLALNAFVPFFLIALPSTPIFGGTKHWMNGLPFLCVAAAWFAAEALARVRAAWAVPAPVVAATVVAIVLPGALISAAMWPYGLGSYNEAIGFARGAANVGMQRTFWGYEPRGALPAINSAVARGGRIHFGDTNFDDWKMYVRDGLLRKDITFSNSVRGSAVASVQPQGEFKEQWMDVWNEWGRRTPALVAHALGVPVATVTFAPAAATPEAAP